MNSLSTTPDKKKIKHVTQKIFQFSDQMRTHTLTKAKAKIKRKVQFYMCGPV